MINQNDYMKLLMIKKIIITFRSDQYYQAVDYLINTMENVRKDEI